MRERVGESEEGARESVSTGGRACRFVGKKRGGDLKGNSK